MKNRWVDHLPEKSTMQKFKIIHANIFRLTGMEIFNTILNTKLFFRNGRKVYYNIGATSTTCNQRKWGRLCIEIKNERKNIHDCSCNKIFLTKPTDEAFCITPA